MHRLISENIINLFRAIPRDEEGYRELAIVDSLYATAKGLAVETQLDDEYWETEKMIFADGSFVKFHNISGINPEVTTKICNVWLFA